MINKQFAFEATRFCITGAIATIIHYAIYWILMSHINTNIAYTIGYAISFVCNFFITSFFTFKTKATVKKGIGFSISHLINYIIQITLLNIIITLNVSEAIAPLFVYAIAIPINFLLIRVIFKKQ